MRAIVFALCICFASATLPAQEKPGNFATVYAQFISNVNHGASKPDYDFLQSVMTASDRVFTTSNANFLQLLYQVSGQQPGIKYEQAVSLILDSVIDKFIVTHYWQPSEASTSMKFNSMLAFVNSETCKCLTRQNDQHQLYDDAYIDQMVQCSKELGTDTTYISAVRKLAGQVTVSDLTAIGALAPKYIFLNCPSFQEAVRKSLNQLVTGPTARGIEYELATRVMALHQAKDAGTLKQIFPLYKKFLPHLDASSKLLNGPGYRYTYDEERRTAADKLTVIHTFYTYDDKADQLKLLAQVTAEVKDQGFNARVISFSFAGPGKISDSARILKKISEVPSPPPPPGNLFENQ